MLTACLGLLNDVNLRGYPARRGAPGHEAEARVLASRIKYRIAGTDILLDTIFCHTQQVELHTATFALTKLNMEPAQLWKGPLDAALEANKEDPTSRFMQLATVKPDGKPSNRTVVFRGFLGDTHRLHFYADARFVRNTRMLIGNS